MSNRRQALAAVAFVVKQASDWAPAIKAADLKP